MFSENEKNKLLTGYKQTIKALSSGKVAKVYLANDCEERLFNEIENTAKSMGVEISYTDSMRELGELCGIKLKASCASILK